MNVPPLTSSDLQTPPPSSSQAGPSSAEERSLSTRLDEQARVAHRIEFIDPYTEELRKELFETLKERVTLGTEEISAVKQVHDSVFNISRDKFQKCDLRGLGQNEIDVLGKAYYWAQAYKRALLIHRDIYNKLYLSLAKGYESFLEDYANLFENLYNDKAVVNLSVAQQLAEKLKPLLKTYTNLFMTV